MGSHLDTEKLLSQSRTLIADANHVGAGFCLADIEMAHTMLDRVDVSHDRAVRERNLVNARTAHDAIAHLRPRLALAEVDAHAVDEALQRLEKRLASYS